MKRLIDPVPAGGAPINNEELNLLFQTEIYDSIQAMLSRWDSDSQGIIVKGCLITGTTGNYAISEGIVYLNGKFMRLPAATGQALPKYIAPKAVSYLTRQFSDGVTRNMIEVVEAELVSSAPGSGQYIAMTSTTDADDRRLSKILTYVDNLTTNNTYQALTAAQGVALKALIDTNSSAISTETTNRIADVDAEEAARISAINSEASTRASADDALQEQIDPLAEQRYDNGAAGTSCSVGYTTILTIPIATGKTATITSEMAAYLTSGTQPVGSSAGGVKIGTFKNVGGTVSQIGATSVLHGVVHDTNSPVMDFSISGTNILVRVQIAAGSDVYRVRCKAKAVVS